MVYQRRQFNLTGLISFTIAATSFLWLSFTRPAQAHHMMGGRLPANIWEGFLSGLAHPVIGLDHLAFIVVVGFLAATLVRGWLLPLPFVVMAMVGTGLHIQKVNLPGSELMIAVSVILLGSAVLWRHQLPFWMLAATVAIAGLFHGYAYGESIVGADMPPSVAYLAGFFLFQYLLALLALQVGRWVMTLTASRQRLITQGLGLFTIAIGLVGLLHQI
jgi:urease accessory protein